MGAAEYGIYAGDNRFYRYGHKAVELIEKYLEPNDKGYYSIPVRGGKYYNIGASKGKFGEFARIGDTCFSVNSYGFMYAKKDTEKGEAFVKALENLVAMMKAVYDTLRIEDGERIFDFDGISLWKYYY